MSAKDFLFSRGLKRITTPKLLGLLVGSLLLFAGLIAFDNARKVPTPATKEIPWWAVDAGNTPDWAKDSPTLHVPTQPISTHSAAADLAIPALAVVLLLTILAASTMLAWRLMKPIGAQKFTLFFGAVVFVLCGLFPPWLYTYDVTATHSRSNAGCAFILSPPLPRENSDAHGIQIDTSCLLIEWACILAATGAGWLLTNEKRKGKEQLLQKPAPATTPNDACSDNSGMKQTAPAAETHSKPPAKARGRQNKFTEEQLKNEGEEISRQIASGKTLSQIAEEMGYNKPCEINLRGRPKKFTPAQKAAERKLVIEGIRDGLEMPEIAKLLNYKSRQGLGKHHPGVRREALSKIKV
jgi:hypothetical protein